MSMTRDEALHRLATARKFAHMTAGDVLDAGELRGGIVQADIDYFRERARLPAQQVALACQGRSHYGNPDGGLPATDAQVVLRVTAAQKNAWVKASQSEGKKLTAWCVERIERA
jgi:hypothetical protein